MSRLISHLPRKPRGPIYRSGLVAGLVSICLVFWILFTIFPPTGWYQDNTFIADTDWLLDLLSAQSLQLRSAQDLIQLLFHWQAAVTDIFSPFEQYDLMGELLWRLTVVLLASLSAAFAAAFYRQKFLEPVDKLKHVRGRQLFKGNRAIRRARKAAKTEIKRSGQGIDIAPGIPMSQEAESKHTFIIGASGGGKTQILLSWIRQLLKRKDRMIIHDTKGDFTATLPEKDFVLLAPHDERSWAWDIAKDCIGLAAARELAARLIPTSKDPLWTNGASEILTGILRWLQKEYGESWTWADIQYLTFSEPAQIRTLLLKAYPEAAGYVDVDPNTGTPHKTSYSFLVTLWSHVGQVVSPLAAAWGNTPEEKRISLTAWLANEATDKPVLILQRSAEFSALSKAWIGAAVQLMANFAASPSLPESRSRRVWLLLDEFAQMGKLDGFQQFLEVGRSRGIRCVLGLQDLEQLAHLYGQESLKTWLNTIETKIICRMNAGPSTNFIAKDLIGEREVSSMEESTSHSHASPLDGKKASTSTSKHLRTAVIPILMASEFESNLGPVQVEGETRIRALLLGRGDLYQLDWPLTLWSEQRPATIPAKWLKD